MTTVAAAPPSIGNEVSTVLGFFASLNDHDIDAALAHIAQDASVEFVAAHIKGTANIEGRGFLTELVQAFPDIRIEVSRTSRGNDGTVTAAIRIEGTQAGEFLGAINQEKYLDLEQAWMFFTAEGAVTDIRAYWCQSQLYRRLAVKRFDQVTITG